MNYREAPKTVVNESANGVSNTRGDHCHGAK